jgi:hypothetical protein
MSNLYERDDLWVTIHRPIKYSKQEAQSFIYDHLGNRHLIYPNKREDIKNIADKSFTRNEVFWAEILNTTRYYNYRNVLLERFQIIDWFPRSPGLTFTLDAIKALKEAEQYREPGSKFVYQPYGKEMALKGGVGSYRFNPFEYQGSKYCLCTATSDGFCHTGIPLAIPLDWMEQIDFSANYKIVGRYQPIDAPIDKYFTHVSKLPKFYFVVEDLEPTGKAYEPVWVTPVVFMQHEIGEKLASYYTCKADDPKALDDASTWLQDYAHRYNSQIVTDYDQQRPAFANVPFSLQNVMAGSVSLQQLLDVGFSKMDAEKIIVQINVSGNFQGNLIVGNNNQINSQ